MHGTKTNNATNRDGTLKNVTTTSSYVILQSYYRAPYINLSTT